MQASLKAFMNGLIDYAGLFPPSALALDEAITNYAHYRKTEHANMLSCFIIPASRLIELDAHSNTLAHKPVFRFSVLGGNPSGLDSYKQAIESMLDDSTTFIKKYSGMVEIPVFEIKLPELPNEAAYQQLISETIHAVKKAGFSNSQLFFEPVRKENWQTTCQHVTSVLKQASKETSVGFKLRCGGITASLFPSVDEVATAIYQTVKMEIPMKATAGLHHPVRHFNEALITKMHGFFNVFGALLLAGEHRLAHHQIKEILVEENPANFHFDEDTFRWKDLSISLSRLEHFRSKLATSYGSCSFDEPLDDLKTLNLL